MTVASTFAKLSRAAQDGARESGGAARATRIELSRVARRFATPSGSCVSNGLTTKADYIAELARDKGQFLPDGTMAAGGPQTALAVDKLAATVTGLVNLPGTYTNQYVIAVGKLEGFTK